MNYPFICPHCNNTETISMKMSEYQADNHFCSICGEEMVREVSSLVCSCSIDKTGDFCKKISI